VKRVSVVVPVYADWPTLSLCVGTLREYYAGRDDVSVWFANDCGPEADELEALLGEAIAGVAGFHYHRNSENLGFVKNCNNAVFNLVDQGDDVLLLNSDTKVTRGFIEELERVVHSRDDIGFASPRSNNATVWSVPLDGRLAEQPERAHRLWAKLSPGLPECYDAPTAHGFCMLIRREVIDAVGLFDEVYGMGYGEENDLTMRALGEGWRCATANRAFVFHYESKSFGDTREARIAANLEILRARYPDYDRLVQDYIARVAAAEQLPESPPQKLARKAKSAVGLVRREGPVALARLVWQRARGLAGRARSRILGAR
jgi:GT2 family glycosyltransferase